MEIIIQYLIQIVKWKHEHESKFNGENQESSPVYILGISPQDPAEIDCCYFNIGIEKVITNKVNGEVFFAKTLNTFKVRNSNHVPSLQFFFDLIEKSTLEFAKTFHERTRNTNLLHHKTPKPIFENLKGDIQMCIDIWDKTTRNTSVN